MDIILPIVHINHIAQLLRKDCKPYVMWEYMTPLFLFIEPNFRVNFPQVLLFT